MKKIQLTLTGIFAAATAAAATINVTPGSLEGLIADGGLKNETTLQLTGTIDARDLAAIENLPQSVATLNLSDVKIQALTTPQKKYFGRTVFSEGEIPAYTFFKSGVSSLVLPADVATIGEGAFAGSDITEITVPDGVTALSDYAFYGCPKLTKVTLPASLQTIGKGAFGNCKSLEKIDLGKTQVTAIPEKAFSGSEKLAYLTLPSGIASIGREAFSHTAIQMLDLSGVSEFEAYALSGMPALLSVAINPDANIGDGILMDNISMMELVGVPEIVPDYFAANCNSLETQPAIRISSTLGKYSFANTLSDELLLPSSVEKIERGALSGLKDIKKIDVTELGERVPEVDEYSFEGLDQPNIELLVDGDAPGPWRENPYWSKFHITTTDPTDMAEIEDTSFHEISITSNGSQIVVKAPSNVTSLRIYTSDGRMAYVASPGKDIVEVDTAQLPSGVLMISVTDADGKSKTVSLLHR